jgi:HAD superfamily hydrolase (TIGR01509 family)
LPESIFEIMAEWTNMVAHHYRTSIPLKPGVAELLEQLRAQGVKLGVGTSNSEPLARAVLAANGVEHYFGCIIVGGGELRGKPCPDIFLAAARCLGVPPARCLVFEDVLAGVQAARAAGMAVVGIRDRHARADWPEMERLADAMREDFLGAMEWLVGRYGSA